MATDQRVLDAAERCMDRFGPRRVSMSDVAAEAGLSRGSVYRYFADRDSLVTAVLERTADRFVAASEPEVDAARDLAGQVGAAAVYILRNRTDDTDSLFATLLSARTHDLFDRWVDFWVPRLQAARARGELRGGLELRAAGEWIVRMLLSFAVMPGDSADDPAAIRRFFRAHLVRGLGPAPAG